MENSAPSLKIFRTKFSTSALYKGRNKNRQQNPVLEFTTSNNHRLGSAGEGYA